MRRTCVASLLLLLGHIAAVQGDGHAESTRSALVIIDVQNCFTRGGTLAVADGDAVIPVINRMRMDIGPFLDFVVLSQDWHCDDHVSFASQHQGYSLYSVKRLMYNAQGELCRSLNVTNSYAQDCAGQQTSNLYQTMWPDHCVKNTEDAKIHPELYMEASDVIVQKGYNCQVDSYSAFYDNGGFGRTELHDVLQSRGITRVYITGLATDYCVHYTAKDALTLGYETFVVLDATRGVAEASTEAAVEDMKIRGINVIDSHEVGHTLMPDSNTSSAATPAVPGFGLAIMLLILTCY